MQAHKAFTLIELLIVIAIIGILSSVVLVNLNGARQRAQNASALATGDSLLKLIAGCDAASGKVTPPGHQITPTNPICNRGAQFGTWVQAPAGWGWYGSVWTNGQENMIHATNPTTGAAMYCGHYPAFTSYCGTADVGLCRLGQGFSCALHDPAVGYYQ